MFYINQDIRINSSIQFSKYGYSNKVVKYQEDRDFKIILDILHVELDEIGIQEKNSILGNNETINIEHKSLKDNFISSSSLYL